MLGKIRHFFAKEVKDLQRKWSPGFRVYKARIRRESTALPMLKVLKSSLPGNFFQQSDFFKKNRICCSYLIVRHGWSRFPRRTISDSVGCGRLKIKVRGGEVETAGQVWPFPLQHRFVSTEPPACKDRVWPMKIDHTSGMTL